MKNNDDNLEKRKVDIDEYFQDLLRQDLLAKGYKIPTIGDYNVAQFIMARTANDNIMNFCHFICAAFSVQEPLRRGIFNNLNRLCEKYKVERIKLTNNGT